MATVLLLILSNVFMTFAWYGHLKFKSTPLWITILVSWGIAFFEYCLQVPANRMGHGLFSAFQLKVIQEVITISVFVAFAILYLNERPQWNHFVSFLCIVGAVYFAFYSPVQS
ncbi:MAG: DMT family protein [Spirochaetia bacterium]|nr:DMT family protein [Spirochaetia bacterium]